MSTAVGSAVSGLNSGGSSDSPLVVMPQRNVYSGDGIRQVRPSPSSFPLPPVKVESGERVVRPSPPPFYLPPAEVDVGAVLCSLSPPPFPAPILQVEGGSRVDDATGPVSDRFWTLEEESVLRAAGIYSPFPVSAIEYYPVLGSCDRCMNGFTDLYQQMLLDGVLRSCPCGMPFPHELILESKGFN